MLGVLVFVVLLFVYLIINNFYFKRKKIEYQFGELLCSVFPTLILLMQIIPSLSLLYYYGLINLDSNLTVKVTGHQWYWSYEFRDIPGLEFDSYIKSLDQLNLGEPRLLEVDNRCGELFSENSTLSETEEITPLGSAEEKVSCSFTNSQSVFGGAKAPPFSKTRS